MSRTIFYLNKFAIIHRIIGPVKAPKNHALTKSLLVQQDIFLKYASDAAWPVFNDLKIFIN